MTIKTFQTIRSYFQRLQVEALKRLVAALQPIHGGCRPKERLRSVQRQQRNFRCDRRVHHLRWPGDYKLLRRRSQGRPPRHLIPGHHNIQQDPRYKINEQQRGWLGPFRTANDFNKSLEQACGASFRVTCCNNAFAIGSSTTPSQVNDHPCFTWRYTQMTGNCVSEKMPTQNDITLEFRSLTCQTLSKVAQYTQPISELAWEVFICQKLLLLVWDQQCGGEF